MRLLNGLRLLKNTGILQVVDPILQKDYFRGSSSLERGNGREEEKKKRQEKGTKKT